MFERVGNQLAHHAIHDHLYVGVVTLASQIGGERDLHLVQGGRAVDEVLYPARQSEVAQHVGREVVRYLAQRAQGLVDHI